MGYHRLSVTVPDDIYKQLKTFAAANNMKLSHKVTDAIREKNRRLQEEAFLQQINEVFDDPSVREEQTAMAESIADQINVDELPW